MRFVSCPIYRKEQASSPGPRCKAPMKEVVRIAPVQNDPGLIAYECPACGYLTSVLIDRQPDDPSGVKLRFTWVDGGIPQGAPCRSKRPDPP